MEFDPNTLERYRLKLRYKVCYHLGSFCPDVDDVVQETFTRFLRALQDEKIRNPESIAAFLSGICNNVMQEYRRWVWREPVMDPDSRPPERPTPPAADLLELRQAIALALTHLSERDRKILQAFYLEEREKEEICQSMDLSDAQFRLVLFRAKERFRKIYYPAVQQKPPTEH